MFPLHLQPESHIPLYIQLRDQLRAMVYAGELRPGDRIPASRELAGQLGVHRTTVANAYADLESEGLIQGHVGRGTFICEGAAPHLPPPRPQVVPGNSMHWESLFADQRGEDSLARLMPDIPDDAIAFVTAKPSDDSFPVEDLRRCVNTVLRREGRKILQLGASDGYPPLRKEIQEMLHGEGMNVPGEQLLITDGCQQSLDLLCKAFLRPGDAVVLENPAYPGAIAIFSAARVNCLAVPVETETRLGGALGLDLHAFEGVLLQNRVKVVLVTPDFQNPTGTTLTMDARMKLLELAGRHQIPVVEDRIYTRLRLRGKDLPSLMSLDRAGVVIQIDSFSKMAFPGMRVGWCVGPRSVIDRLRLVKQFTDLHTDQVSQAALAEFLKRGYLKRHTLRMRKIYGARLEALELALGKFMPEGVTWTAPHGGMSVWVTLPAGLDAGELLIHVRERGVFFIPGRAFYFQNPRPNTLRLGFAGVTERQIAKGVETLGELVASELRKRRRGVGREPAAVRMALV
jgi:2-aminoadipate transaminase